MSRLSTLPSVPILTFAFKPAAGKIFCSLKGHDARGVLVAFSARKQILLSAGQLSVIRRDAAGLERSFLGHLAPHVTPLPGARLIKGFLTSNLVPT